MFDRLFAIAASLLLTPPILPIAASSDDMDAIEQRVKAGETLPAEVAARFPLEEQKVESDTGVNVLVDLAHGANFNLMWGLPQELRKAGYRVVGSHASLDTVLDPEGKSRARVPIAEKRRPLAWIPNPKFNVVITRLGGLETQGYLPEERAALKRFVEESGGLIVAGGLSKTATEEELNGWSLNALLQEFGAAFQANPNAKGKGLVFSLGPEWEVASKGADGQPDVARRAFGQGRVVVFRSADCVSWNKKAKEGAPDSKSARVAPLIDTVKWAAGGAPPVAGSLRLPQAHGGDGGIFPEMEERFGSFVIFYAKNQKPELIDAIKTDMPAIKKQIEEWLPSPPVDETMYMLLCSGAGGGWAVNIYTPKEVGIISLQKEGVLSVFSHELAHTMRGPANDQGGFAGKLPIPLSEPHAGWFQGKIVAMRAGGDSVKNCNRLFEFDKDGAQLDLANQSKEYKEKWGKGKDWTKIWWVWAKLDDRYGPTWYPRWKWVQNTRWADQPDHQLTFEEMVEDMSIAVGEDLFPFFKRISTTLTKDRCEKIAFQGETMDLPAAPIDVTPAGKARLEAIGDYRKPPR